MRFLASVHASDLFSYFWAQRMQISFYPITDEKILKYAVELDARECVVQQCCRHSEQLLSGWRFGST